MAKLMHCFRNHSGKIPRNLICARECRHILSLFSLYLSSIPHNPVRIIRIASGHAVNPAVAYPQRKEKHMMSHQGERKIQMNIVHKAILRACWQEENKNGMHVMRPWLRWFLTRVVGIEVIFHRKSERIRMTNEKWLAVRKEAALRIDPETAEVSWEYGQTLDPYRVRDYLPEECQQIGRNYFARSPGSDLWVSFDDLPYAVCQRLWARLSAGEFDDEKLDWLFGDLDTGAADTAKVPANG
jgi:hypothetical protein